MDIIGYPPALRKQLADMELEHERGELSDTEYAAAVDLAMTTCRAKLGIHETYRDTSKAEPTVEAVDHNPNGLHAVWYRYPEDVAAFEKAQEKAHGIKP